MMCAATKPEPAVRRTFILGEGDVENGLLQISWHLAFEQYVEASRGRTIARQPENNEQLRRDTVGSMRSCLSTAVVSLQ